LTETEILLKSAIEKEDYDEAAELDEAIESIKFEIDALGFLNDKLQVVIESLDDN